jgi:hypothetical protein
MTRAGRVGAGPEGGAPQTKVDETMHGSPFPDHSQASIPFRSKATHPNVNHITLYDRHTCRASTSLEAHSPEYWSS